jgi:hypothetical protein
MNKLIVLALVVAAASACGFDCQVKGEKQSFSDCQSLQDAYDTEKDSVDGADNEVLDDLDTCGEINGCEVKQ